MIKTQLKYLIIGSTGMVGSALERVKEHRNSVFVTHQQLDILDLKQIEGVFDQISPQVVINTAAYLGAEQCTENSLLATQLNCKAVCDLATVCKEREICLVHLSTDAVFDGNKTDDYYEDDLPLPLNMYGMTKHLGELHLQSIDCKYYLIRIPILFGSRKNQGEIFIEKMLKLAQKGAKELRVVDDIISNPSFSDDIAKGIYQIVESNQEYGLFHLKNSGKASMFQFVKTFFEFAGLDINIVPAKAADFAMNDKAKRPLNTSIGSKKIKPLRPWTESVKDYLNMGKIL